MAIKSRNLNSGKKNGRERIIKKILRNWDDVVTMEDYRTQKRYISNFIEAGKFIAAVSIVAVFLGLLVR